ncbi:MAG TPA: hypothetical protein DEF43_16295 [Chloroflexus aurantiacus]|jgi:hypothetical protein|uniref:hypothetical protein n=1 Tax=Chloroflexus TaxID=1107 RepID=UPI0000459345|nr:MULTISPECIES: hypothetical protein [Chloroflexus]RMG50971.1 MAG: hypothetical protein D6716_07175 [Chloroflexota bacterium]GIV92070.1 MAG: hypothetical protein KatS3mg056_0779 [Chloroflexus sp.]HBW68676.1 hypothetical protein [Chloroflexus aurantiacus]
MGDTWLELAAAEIHQRDLIRNAERERLIRMAKRSNRDAEREQLERVAKRSNRERTWWQRMLEWVRRTNA